MTSPSKTWLLFFMVTATLAGSVGPSLAADAGTGRVLSSRGVAEFLDATEWRPLRIGAALREGTTMRTGPGSHVELRLGDGTLIRVLENSGLTLITLRGNGATTENTVTELDLRRGRVIGVARELSPASRCEIRTPTCIAGIRGGEFQVAQDGEVKIRRGIAVVVRQSNTGELVPQTLRDGVKLLPNGTVHALTEQELSSREWLSESLPMASPPAGPAGSGSGHATGHAAARPGPQGSPGSTIRIMRLFYATDRKRTGSEMAAKFYGGRRSAAHNPVEYGVCHVTIPPNHEFARLEQYAWWRLETRNEPDRHVTLQSLRPKPETNFMAELRAAMDNSEHRELMVFVHGYNVSWEESACRAAQIAHDIGVDRTRGAPFLFSWPSQGAIAAYVSDEANIRVTKFHLANVLTNLAAQSGARAINVLAHSMGNQALAESLHMIGLTMREAQEPLLNQVVMAAPDIDVEQLANMSTEMRRTAKGFTIYSCKSDLPVRLSTWFHGANRRVGSFAVINGFDTIDSTLLEAESLLNHSYVGDEPRVLRDLRKIFRYGCSIKDRCCCCFEPRQDAAGGYWAFRSGNVDGCTHDNPCP